MVSGQEQLNRRRYQDDLETNKNDHQLLIDIAMQQYDMNIKLKEVCDGNSGGTNTKKQTGFNVTTVANSFVTIFNTVAFWINSRGGV
jgi:hypothetical protein